MSAIGWVGFVAYSVLYATVWWTVLEFLAHRRRLREIERVNSIAKKACWELRNRHFKESERLWKIYQRELLALREKIQR